MIPRNGVRILLVYPPLVLIAGSLISDASAASATVGLVVLYVACLLAGWWPGFLVSALAGALAAPVLASPYLGDWSVLLAIPVIGAVSRGLQGLAPALIAVEPPVRRTLSPLAGSVVTALAVILVVAVVLSSPVLALTSLLLIVTLVVMAAVQSRRLGSAPLVVEHRVVTVRAGQTIDVELVPQPDQAHAGALFRLSGLGDAVVQESGPFVLGAGDHNVVSATPMLGGPTELAVRAAVSDPLGLVHVGQTLSVAHLNVIPRARVARWAAEEFLAHRGGGSGAGTTLSREVAGLLAGRQGVEYVSSRVYVPGDLLVSIDWKHTSRLQSPVVKTFNDGARSAGLLLVGLAATDADEADRLVYEFLSAALTIATMSGGASIATYVGGGGYEVSPVRDGDALVVASLRACSGVAIVPPWRRATPPVSMQKLQEMALRTRGVGSRGAQRLSELLTLREHALRTWIDDTPVASLLRETARRQQPAWCVAVSAMLSDAEAVLSALRQMERGGVRTRLIDVSLPVRGRRTGRRNMAEKSTSIM